MGKRLIYPITIIIVVMICLSSILWKCGSDKPATSSNTNSGTSHPEVEHIVMTFLTMNSVLDDLDEVLACGQPGIHQRTGAGGD